MIIIKKGFKISIGWNLGTKGKSIHLIEPFTSIPINGTKTKVINEIQNKIIDIESEVSSSVDPYSDWSFNRITLISSLKSSASFSEDNLLKKFVGFTYGGYRGRIFAGKIWTNKSGVPNQEAYNIEGNSSADMFRISYLRNHDSFFGITEINNNYHMAGEGNIRGFVSQNEKGKPSVKRERVS